MLRAIFEIAAVVVLRFPRLVRIWALLVVAVNAASVFFLGSLEGKVVLLAVLAALAIMAPIYKRWGFVRLLGIGHMSWFAMLPWLSVRLRQIESDSLLYRWLVVLIVVNSICLIIDVVDVSRFIAGDREPHYHLEEAPASAEDNESHAS